MARSKNYKVAVDFYEGNDYSVEHWAIYVWEKGWAGKYVGNQTVDHKPEPAEMETVARQLIDKYLAEKSKEQKVRLNVRHP